MNAGNSNPTGKSTATTNNTNGVNMDTDLLANMSTFVRNSTPGTKIRVVSSGGKATVYTVEERYAHRGRTGRTILTLSGGKKPLFVGAKELLQAFGTEVYFQASATPVPTGTRGIKQRSEAEIAEIEAKKEAVKAARKAAKAGPAQTRVEGPAVAPAASVPVAVVEAAPVAEESEVVEETEVSVEGEPSAQTIAEESDSGVSMVSELMESASEGQSVAEPMPAMVEDLPVIEAASGEVPASDGETISIADILKQYKDVDSND